MKRETRRPVTARLHKAVGALYDPLREALEENGDGAGDSGCLAQTPPGAGGEPVQAVALHALLAATSLWLETREHVDRGLQRRYVALLDARGADERIAEEAAAIIAAAAAAGTRPTAGRADAHAPGT